MAQKKRSNQKIVTRRAQIIRFMRLSRNISQRQAALLCQCSEQGIGHYENGRMDISDTRLEIMLNAYGYTNDQFNEFLSGKEIPTDFRNECISILAGLDETKLRLIHGVLLNFTKT